MKSKLKGRFAEIIACLYLTIFGYRIIERNYKATNKQSSFGEVDIIAKRGKLITFVEVKYRSSKDDNILEYILSKKQINRISNAANYYLHKYTTKNYQARIDLIYIGPSLFKVSHIKNITI